MSKLSRRVISYEEAESFARIKDISYIETSAKMNIRVDEAFGQVASEIMEKINTNVIDPRNEVK